MNRPALALPAVAAATANVSFQLHTLGWKDFQRLVHTCGREVFGAALEQFRETADEGLDGLFVGPTPSKLPDLPGPVAIQAKHSAKAAQKWTAAMLDDELPKIERLVAAGRIRSYVLVTSMPLSAAERDATAKALENVGVATSNIFGREWLEQTILESPRLRMLVPRLYGLGDLGQILDERAFAQARQVLAMFRERAPTFVRTEAYGRAASALEKHGFVLLLGEPAAGKTTVASVLGLAALDNWRSSVVFVTSPADIRTNWNPNDSRQFFWIDDAFGATQHDPSRTHDWNSLAPVVQAAVKQGAKFVMTSRDYIYRAARSTLKLSAFPLLGENEVVVSVTELSVEEKEQILYNHLRLGNQSAAFLEKLKPFLPEAARSPRFLPESARRLGDASFTRGVELTRQGILAFFEKPERYLREVIENLDAESQAVLGLLLAEGGTIPSPFQPTRDQERLLQVMGGTLAGGLAALKNLQGSIVELRQTENGTAWGPKHPTMLDALASQVSDRPELLESYVRGAPADRLFREVQLEKGGHGILVPPAMHGLLAERLLAGLTRPGDRRSCWNFLTHKASPAFIEKVLSKRPSLENPPEFNLYLNTDERLPFYCRLVHLGRMRPDHRQSIIDQVFQALLDAADPSVFTEKTIRAIMNEEDEARLSKALYEDVLPRLEDIAADEWSNAPRDRKSPEEAFSTYTELLQGIEDWFPGDAFVSKRLDAGREKMNDLGAEEWTALDAAADDYRKEMKARNGEKSYAGGGHSVSERSVFDDLGG